MNLADSLPTSAPAVARVAGAPPYWKSGEVVLWQDRPGYWEPGKPWGTTPLTELPADAR
jgi:hypothetical protein